MSRFNPQRAARGLVEASVCGDEEAARRVRVTPQTIRNWRSRRAKDPELAALVAEGMTAIDDRWRQDLQEVVVQAAVDIRALQARSFELVMDVLDRPEDYRDAEGVAPTPLDQVKLIQGAIASVRLTLSSSTEMLTHYAAIVAPPVTIDGTSQAHQPNGSAPKGSDAVSDGATTRH